MGAQGAWLVSGRAVRIGALTLAAVALVLAGVAVGIAVQDEDDSTSDQVERPSVAGGPLSGGAETRYRGRAELAPSPTTRSVRPPKQTPRTPESFSTQIVESTDVPATEMQAPDDPGTEGAFAVFGNSLVNEGAALWIAEPDVASKGDRALVTWNHGAAFTSNGGESFTLVSHDELRRGPGGYCCDQLALYEPARDLWIWFVQGEIGPSLHNQIRISVAKGDEDFDSRSFKDWTFSAESFRELLDEADPKPDLSSTFLDYPNIDVTAEHLFLTINVYSKGVYANTIVLRIALDDLAAKTDVPTWRYVADPHGTARLVDGASDTMYFAQHIDSATLRIWRWGDAEVNPTTRDVAHSSYTRNQLGYTCKRTGANTGDWCKRLRDEGPTNDDRPTSAWLTDGVLGFAWNANNDPDRNFPYPFVMVVRVDAETFAVKDEPHIWSPNHAYQYAAISPNARGDLGGVAIAGGGAHYWTCTALVNDDASGGAWEARVLDVSDADAAADETGDYLGATPYEPGSNTWKATCMTLDGGGLATDVQVRLYHIGRADQND